MILADTSAWVELLRATGSSIDTAMCDLVGTPRLATTDPVVAEITAGARSVEHARTLRAMLDATRFHPVRPLFEYERAASIYSECRRAGVTIGSLIDCLVAAVALRHDLEVLHHDRDFDRMAEVVPLRIAG